MKRFCPENTDSGMFEAEDGPYVLFEEYRAREDVLQKNHTVLLAHYHAAAQRHVDEALDLQRQLAETKGLLTEGVAIMSATHQEVADLQRQLADAIRERDQYKAACEMATALRPLGAVQVIDGGAAVLLDTSKGAT